MARTTFISVLLGLLLLLSGCGTGSTGAPPSTETPSGPQPPATNTPLPTPDGPIALGQPFQLQIDQSAQIGRLSLTLTRIANDSRCPTLVACAWEGAAEATIAPSLDGTPLSEQTLTLYGHNRETDEARVQIDVFLVRFIALDPYPASPGSIPLRDYRATFVVEELAALTPTARPAYPPVSGDGYEGVIVPEHDAGAFEPRAEGYWTPTADDVARLEAGLPEYLRQAAPERAPQLWQRLGEYKRQYAGLIRDGRRLVYANYFCSTFDDSWRSAPLFVMDGGACFFQLTYDVERDSYQDLMVNGDA